MSIKLLIIEDDAVQVRLLKMQLDAILEVRFDYVAVGSMAAAEGELRANGIDVCILDLGLPDSMGLEAIARLHNVSPHVAIVVLSGNESLDTAVQAMRLGAQDYFCKPADPRTLARALRLAVARQHEKTRTVESAVRPRSKVEWAVIITGIIAIIGSILALIEKVWKQ